jgi:hypothetical protein
VTEAGSPRSNLGIEWDEPHEFSEIRASLREEVPADGLEAEYWVSSWPAPEGRGGWTLTDSPFIGKWVRIHTYRASEGGKMVLRFRALSAEENPNVRSRAGWAPRFHHQEVWSYVVELANVGMIERSNHPRFPFEALTEPRGRNFDRDVAV